jgi:hypothetical protein
MFFNTDHLAHILVFKTNIETPEQKQKLLESLTSHEHVAEASVDMEDVDKVLRIVSHELRPKEIITKVNQQGFFCEELD